jgi:peptidyl-prolyl cis-trans isomerase SurA
MRLLLPGLLAGCVTSSTPTDVEPVDPAGPPAAAETPDTDPTPPGPPPVPEIEPDQPRYAATHVLVAWAGAVGAPPGVTRSEAEARSLAAELHARAAAGTPLEELARAHSDGPSAPRGGGLGVYATGTMVPDFEKAVASVAPGALAPLVRTPFGYHVVRRDPVMEGRFAHVQISHREAWRATTARTPEEARARLAEARAALEAGTPFEEVARRYSDDPSAALNGGDLGLVAPGQLVPAFEDAAFALAPGETSGVVETPYGVHLIRRLPIDAPLPDAAVEAIASPTERGDTDPADGRPPP